MSKFIIMCGLPGSGKTTYIKKFHKDKMVVSKDDIRRDILKKDIGNAAEESYVHWLSLRCLELFFRANKDIVYDITALKPKYRKEVANLAKRCGYKVECYIMDTPIDLCKERAEKRSGKEWSTSPSEVIDRMNKGYVFPKLSEGFDKLVIIKGEKNDKERN